MAPTTRSAARSAADDKGHAVLRVLLEHPAVYRRTELVCRLLACSKAVGEAAAECCAGRLPACIHLDTVAAAESLGRWVARRGGLVCGLYITIFDPPSSVGALSLRDQASYHQALRAALVAGLSAAPAGSLQCLQWLRWTAREDVAPPLLLLPRLLGDSSGGIGGLTQLVLGLCSTMPAAECAGLAALTGLRDVSFGLFSSEQHAELAPALAGLSMLTRVGFAEDSVVDTDVVQQLPCSLRELCFDSTSLLHSGARKLRHLTALTRLTLGEDDEVWEARAWELPQSLVEVDSWSSYTPAAPLLGLTSLTGLAIRTGPGELVQLRALTSLVDLRVVHEAQDAPFSEVLAACKGLPLRDLTSIRSHGRPFAEEVTAALPHVHGVAGTLSSFKVASMGFSSESASETDAVDAQALAQLLRPLTQLRELQLHGLNIGGCLDAASAHLQEQAVRPVVQAVVGLRRLECLHIGRLPDSLRGAVQLDLAGATQLTQLRIW